MKINDNDLRILCLELAKAESEDQVIQILTNIGYWDDPAAWQYYGGNESNFSEIGNQQENADTAVVEKYINSIDAMLLAKCAEDGVKPDSEDAPKSISDALNKYFDITNGKLSSLSAQQRSKLAENIGIVATGQKKQPCYSFFDFGVGQAPSEFPKTFLSLAASNKIRIQFVQGRFNMGSTGVLQFCGDKNVQLIISKKHPSARKGLKDGNKWGFTVVRREDPDGQMKSSVYKFLAPKGKIPEFGGKDLPILPSKYPESYGRSMSHGTFVKVYDYNIGTGLRTNILLDLYNRLSILTPSLALPVRLYERRLGYKANSYESNLAGLSVRLEEDKLDNLEEGFPASHKMSIDGHSMTASIYAFKKGAIEKYAKGEGVIFALNGQTHGALDNNFFKRTATGMSYLAKSLLVVIDCSSIDGRTREDLFMNSRDRLRSHPLKKAIEKELESVLRQHPGLKTLREKRQAEAVQDKLGDSKPLQEVIESIVKISPTLSKLFKQGLRVKDPFSSKDKKQTEKFEGKVFPTFFDPEKNFEESSPKTCHKNFRFRIKFSTDANNDYFNRDVDAGNITVFANGAPIADYSLILWDGKASLSAALPYYVKIGDVLSYKIEVSDVTYPKPIEHDIWVKVLKEGTSGESGKKTKKKKSSGKETGGNELNTGHLDVPDPIPVKKDGWEDAGFDEQHALSIKHTGEGNVYDYFYNADNIYLKIEQKHSPNDAEIIEAQFKTSLVLIGLALINEAVSKNNDEVLENLEEQVLQTTRSVSPILLPMIRSLGELTLTE